METGKLNIFKSKDKKPVVEILFTNKKGKQTKLCVQGAENISNEYSGKDVEFERDGKGQVTKIFCEGKVLFSMKMQNQPNTSIGRETHNGKKASYAKTSPNPQSENQMETEHLEKVQYPASAPYNFIPLNKVVVKAEEPLPFDKYHDGRYTGWIDLEIETKTPLYIRDTLNEDERKKKAEAEKEDRKYDNPKFFSPGKLRIPGSSLRGMTRNMVEIVSFGKFGFYDYKRLYFRSLGDKSKLGDDYREMMIDEADYCFPKVKAGILKRDYKIYPSDMIKGTQIYRINFDKTTKIVAGTNFKVPVFEFREIYFQPVSPQKHTHTLPNGKKLQLKYALLNSVSLNQDAQHPNKGFIIASGEFGKKKHMHWVINEENPDSKFLEINDDLLQSYKDDVNREEQADLLKQLKNHPEGVPCFYITDEQGKVSSFGHTGMFRLAYEKTIGEHIPEDINPDHPKNKRKIDLAEAIFGKIGKDKEEKTIPGRVFFEDAFLKEGQQAKDVLMDKKTPQILAAPKPTTFQHYLVQTQDNNKELNHYNSNSAIRGYKLYWHKSGNGWEERDEDKIQKAPKQYTEITPVKPKTRFSGRIRFENLSEVELGALLFSLDLSEVSPDLHHKLGMGKPLGLGSIKISPKLYLSDRKKRYTDLFAEWDNEIPPSDRINDMKRSFKEHVLNKIREQHNSLWDTARLNELKLMLNYEKGTKLESENQYMEIDKFKKRPILPKPSST